MTSFLSTLAFPVACAFTGAAAALLVSNMIAVEATTCPPAPIVEIHPHMLAPPAPPAPPPPAPAPVIAFHQHTVAPPAPPPPAPAPAPVAERAAFEPLPEIPPGAVRCANAGRCSVDRKYLFGLLEDPRQLEQQARILPSIKDGVMQGLKFYGIRPDSLPRQLGIKNGDMLVAVDGVAVTSLEPLLNLKFRPEQSSYLFTFKRKGETVGLRVGLH